jgi:benzoyl-CoA reductase/2-hydroxyglutaryl-CoA dehydratase subunit BcrC/BadD/HgdB
MKKKKKKGTGPICAKHPSGRDQPSVGAGKLDLSPFSARQITITEWDRRYAELREGGLREPEYGGPLSRHVDDGDLRLQKLRMDNSPAALRLWNFFLSEEDRLHRSVAQGKKLVGTMKDLGTVPVMAYSLSNLAAFYPDGAWWLPCVMECSTGLLEIADSLGIDDSFCPVRALLGAFVKQENFPIPGLLICSVGATCDDFSAIAQRLESLGFPIMWWEIPHRRRPAPFEADVELPGGFQAPADQVAFVKSELERVREALEAYSGEKLTDELLSAGIERANQVRSLLQTLRQRVYCANPCPLPSLEMLIAEMLAIHFCSDHNETIQVLTELLEEVDRRIQANIGVLAPEVVRVFWLNPVADLRAMNLLEDAGARVCGADYMISHALDTIPIHVPPAQPVPPMEALARTALADTMIGSAADRAQRICADITRFGAEALVISRIPGASHCAMEAVVIGEFVQARIDIPVLEIEVPPLTDAIEPTLRTRLEALVETVRSRTK